MAGVPWVGSGSRKKVGPIGQHKSILIKKKTTTTNTNCKPSKESCRHQPRLAFRLSAGLSQEPEAYRRQLTEGHQPLRMLVHPAKKLGLPAHLPGRRLWGKLSLAVSALHLGVSTYPHLGETT